MAALITADADATMAADVITDVDVTVDGDFQAEIIPAAIFSAGRWYPGCGYDSSTISLYLAYPRIVQVPPKDSLKIPES